MLRRRKKKRKIAPPPRTISQKKQATLYFKEILWKTKLKDIMIKNIITLDINAKFGEVPRKMLRAKIRHLPVLDEDKKFAGLITERDLYRIKSPRKLMDGTWYYDEFMLNNIILKHVMVKKVITMGPEASVWEALITMVHNKFGCIPVLNDEGYLIGIVTQHDLLKRAADFF